ncbi:DNA internalization-related competence protein ComEC/Rec2 [Vibrio sp. SCSIO 43137]|uniref:DNA internalization-related competence protein ComEC/Rec2 n=1 Tax=Vibrio sp. SCSIO 43137 TaxID=3021011 RepID=UPI0023078140|nr:DNA internalization-related competence protein ComEC/Rec2 [Vibrio sp. SCSIO 43137]WCE28621.1 DNA internalization-related competence protein ComEC/Rec2 [Vibrio sp. SCSIO 43137]
MTLFVNYWNLVLFNLSVLFLVHTGIAPDWRWLFALLLYSLASLRFSSLKWTHPLFLAFCVVLSHNYLFQKKIENLFQAGEDININARVNSFFDQISHGYEYLIIIEKINDQKLAAVFQPQVKLFTGESLKLLLGERWNLDIKLKKVNGKLNQAGFDQEKYYLSQNWQGKAVVSDNSKSVRLEQSDSVRAWLQQRVFRVTEKLDSAGILLALSFSDRSHISSGLWQQLKQSGLIHLVAISGLHIGIAYLSGWYLGWGLRLVIPALYWLPVFSGVLSACGYAWLAGFSLPTVRALVMCLIFSLCTIVRMNYSSWLKLWLTVAVILFSAPMSVLSASFWMSFTAVGAIFMLLEVPSIQAGSKLIASIKLQAGLFLLLLPSTLLLFDGISLFSPVYNLIFIPWFSFIVVPVIFLSLLLSAITAELSLLLWSLADLLLQPVVWAIGFSMDGWQAMPAELALTALVLIVVLLVRGVMPAGVNNALIAIVLPFLWLREPEHNSEPVSTEWQLNVLDVGHGLSLLIEKQGKFILYDTGDAWPRGSIAESVVIPVMERLGSRNLDGLILSHLDSDHAGGRKVIEQRLNPATRFASQYLGGYQPCVRDTMWQWRGLDFKVLWPPKMVSRAYNPHSCVIHISDGVSGVLLTGDIDAVSELILAQQPEKISADILIVPHHGSNSSSKSGFIRAVSPSLAIASAARDGRWELPNKKVTARYSSLGVELLDTGHSGQIIVHFSRRGFRVRQLRATQSLAWYRQMLRKGVE